MNDLLALSLLGGVLALDGTSVGQVMVSRPLVAAFLGGVLLGAPATGLLVGAVMDVYLLVSFPVGGARFPEGATAAVVATSVAVESFSPDGVAIGVALGLVWGQVGGWTVSLMRGWNASLSPDPAGGRVSPSRVVGAHLSAVLLDLTRGTLVTAGGVALGALLLRYAPAWPLSAPDTRGLLLVGAAVSVGVLLRSFGGARRRGALFVVGLVAGLVAGSVL